MNTEGLTTLSNYALGTTPFPANTKIELVNNKRVKITLPAGHGLTGTHTINVAGTLKDLAGNAIGGLYGASTNTITFGTPTTFTITPVANSLKLVAANQLQFEVPTELSAADASKFAVSATGVTGAAATISSVTYVNNNGKAIVTVTLNENLATTDLANIVSLTINADALTNSVGTKLSGTTTFSNSAGHVQDKLAPAIKSVTTKTVNTVEISFSEPINKDSVSIASFTVAGNTVTGINWNTNADVLTLTLKDAIETDAKPALTQAVSLQDASANVLAAGTAVKATVDGIAPVIKSAVLSADKKQVTVTFSEAVSTDNSGSFVALVPADFTLSLTGFTGTFTVDHKQATANQAVLTLSAAATGAKSTDTIAASPNSIYDLSKNAMATTPKTISGGIVVTGVGGSITTVIDGTADTPAVKASLTEQGITFTAVSEVKAEGKAITVELKDPSGNDQPLSVVVTGTNVVVNLATDNTGAITSTATDVVTAINALTGTERIITASGTGATPLTAKGPQNLSGGADFVAGNKEKATLTITGPATATGTINVTLTNPAVSVDVQVTTGQTAAQVAANVAAALNGKVAGYTVTNAGTADVVIEATTSGDKPNMTATVTDK
jgi:hypothetical protein